MSMSEKQFEECKKLAIKINNLLDDSITSNQALLTIAMVMSSVSHMISEYNQISFYKIITEIGLNAKTFYEQRGKDMH